jgi:hypothetical protein
MSRPGVRAKPVAHFSRLESAVMAALAAELRHAVPDLAAQFRNARPGLKRNMTFGYYCGLTGGGARPASTRDGALGSVHVLIDGLHDAVAFRVLMRQGRAVAIEADSYGQDTRAIDFDHVGFEQVFTVNASGQSVLFEGPSAIPTASAAARPRQIPAAPRPTAAAPAHAQSPAAVIVHPRPVQSGFGPNGAVGTPSTPRSQPEADTPNVAPGVLLLGAWAVIAAVAVLAVLIFDLPIIFAAVAAFWIGNAVRQPKVLAALQRGVAEYQKSQAAQG